MTRSIRHVNLPSRCCGRGRPFSVVNNAYDAGTGALTIYNAEDAAYSSLPNPFKTFAADTAGLKRINIRAAVEDAVASGASSIAILLTEEQENSLFAVAGSASAQPPTLDVYLKSGLNSGAAQWSAGPSRGQLPLAASSPDSTSAVADSQVIPLIVENPIARGFNLSSAASAASGLIAVRAVQPDHRIHPRRRHRPRRKRRPFT
jgi:hypothetical protein